MIRKAVTLLLLLLHAHAKRLDTCGLEMFRFIQPNEFMPGMSLQVMLMQLQTLSSFLKLKIINNK